MRADSFLKYIFLPLIFFSASVSAEKEDDYDTGREFELGLRLGTGYHAKDRFESSLSSFKSLNSVFTPSVTELSPFRRTGNSEFFFRARWSRRWKVGFTFGNLKQEKFLLQELSSNGNYSRLKFNMNTDFLFINAYYEWYFRKFSVELGGGLGVNNTNLNSDGFNYTSFGFSAENGRLTGSGLAYRLETALNKRITENLTFQIGAAVSVYTVPYFSGSLNDSSGTYYVKSDGTVSQATASQAGSTVLSDEINVRRLDMVLGNFQIYMGTMLRFRL